MKSKTCTKCGESKLLDQFGRRSASPDGRANSCRGCVKAINRAAYLANREERKAYRKAYYAEHREQAARQKKAHYAQDRERIAARTAAYYAKNRDRIRAYVKPRWTGEIRPTADGSKPANGQDPGPVRFYPAAASACNV